MAEIKQIMRKIISQSLNKKYDWKYILLFNFVVGVYIQFTSESNKL